MEYMNLHQSTKDMKMNNIDQQLKQKLSNTLSSNYQN